MSSRANVTAFIAELARQLPADSKPGYRSAQRAATEAAAYKIWGDNNLHGWDRTLSEVAETTGLPAERIMRIVSLRGWMKHLRLAKRDFHPGRNLTARVDETLEAMDAASSWHEPA